MISALKNSPESLASIKPRLSAHRPSALPQSLRHPTFLRSHCKLRPVYHQRPSYLEAGARGYVIALLSQKRDPHMHRGHISSIAKALFLRREALRGLAKDSSFWRFSRVDLLFALAFLVKSCAWRFRFHAESFQLDSLVINHRQTHWNSHHVIALYLTPSLPSD